MLGSGRQGKMRLPPSPQLMHSSSPHFLIFSLLFHVYLRYISSIFLPAVVKFVSSKKVPCFFLFSCSVRFSSWNLHFNVFLVGYIRCLYSAMLPSPNSSFQTRFLLSLLSASLAISFFSLSLQFLALFVSLL